MKVGNNPQKQLYENTKDIDMLKDKIREAYHYNGSLDPTDVTCSRGTITSNFGYLFDNDANLFKFSDGDNNTLLIQYLTNLKGPQGIAGGTVPVEANPNEDATDTLNKILIGDTVYTAGGGSGGTKYIHTILLTGNAPTGVNSQATGSIYITIESDSNLPFVKTADYVEGTNQNIDQWLIDAGYGSDHENPVVGEDPLYPIALGSAGTTIIWGIGFYYNSTDGGLRYYSAVCTSTTTYYYKWNGTTLTDIKIVQKI